MPNLDISRYFGVCRVPNPRAPYFHALSRACVWTRPYVCAVDVEAHRPPNFSEFELRLLHALSRIDAEEASRSGRTRKRPLTSSERDAASLTRRSISRCIRYSQFTFEHAEPLIAKRKHLFTMALLAEFSQKLFAAQADVEVERALGGPWKRPPFIGRVKLLGIPIATEHHTHAAECKGMAAEAALLKLCPLAYQEALRSRKLGQHMYTPVIIDPHIMMQLSLRDERIFNLDQCLGPTPNQILQEYMTRRLGQTLSESSCEKVANPETQEEVWKFSYTVGARVFEAVDALPRRARQRAALAALVHAHPGDTMWHELLSHYQDLDAILPLLKPRSRAATEAIVNDKLSNPSERRRKREAKLRERSVPEIVGLPVENNCETSKTSDEVRQVPGSGPMFALNWQRQADLERERQAVLDEGELIENDTQFAIEYDKKRERQDNKQLALLKRMELDTRISEEPSKFDERSPLEISAGSQQKEQPKASECHAKDIDDVPAYGLWICNARAHSSLLRLAKDEVRSCFYMNAF
ncbi:MAG: hypothetical protein SGPRY_003754 [Prymnesium sp.]